MISIKRRLNRIEYHDMIFVVFDKNYHFRWNRHLLLEEDLRVEAVGTLERTLRLSPTRAKTGTKMVLIKGCTTCQDKYDIFLMITLPQFDKYHVYLDGTQV